MNLVLLQSSWEFATTGPDSLLGVELPPIKQRYLLKSVTALELEVCYIVPHCSDICFCFKYL